MTLEEVLKKKKDLESQLKDVNKEFEDTAKGAFAELAKKLFSKYSALKFVTWTQADSGWNDGDPSYFYSNYNCYSINTTECEEFDDEGFEVGELDELQKELDIFMTNFKTSDMERIFGDGVRVTLTKNGVNVDSYYD